MIKNRIKPGDGDPRHGTWGGYTNHGCRCPSCRAAHAEGQAWNRIARPELVPGDPRHGTLNGYDNYLCRCQRCTAAKRSYDSRWAAAKRARIKTGESG